MSASLSPSQAASAFDETADHSLLIRLAADLSAQSEPVVLILDNAEVLSGRGVLDGIDFLLRHAGARLRLVLLTRVDPALPLHRYRLAGSMTEVRLDELAFTPVEARAVLTAHDADPEMRRSPSPKRRTGGLPACDWPRWRSGTDRNPGACPPATVSEIAAYFRAEFLDVQPPAAATSCCGQAWWTGSGPPLPSVSPAAATPLPSWRGSPTPTPS